MGWDHIERQKRPAPIGEYRPEVYHVTVHDTLRQLELEMAALGIENGMSVAEFLLFSARYVIRRHRRLKKTRMVLRMGLREIRRAVREPIGPEVQELESERDRRRRYAIQRFKEWAWPELFPQGVQGERP
jgi:uncharacterized protein (UPF0305 family)